jgi:hypothetical protein
MKVIVIPPVDPDEVRAEVKKTPWRTSFASEFRRRGLLPGGLYDLNPGFQNMRDVAEGRGRRSAG